VGKVKKQMTPYSLGIHINANGNASSGLLGAAASASKLGQTANITSRGIGGLHQRLSGLGTSSRFVRGLVQDFAGLQPALSKIGAASRVWAGQTAGSILGTLNPMKLYQMRQEAIRREALRQAEGFELAKKSLGAFQDKQGRWRHSRGRYLSIGELESIGIKKATPVVRGFAGLLGGLGNGARGAGQGIGGLLGGLGGLGGGARGAGQGIDGMNLSLLKSHGLLLGLSGAAATAGLALAGIAKSGFDLNVKEESQMNSLTAIMASIYEFRDKKTGALLDNEKELQAAGIETERIYRELKDRSLGAPGTTEDLLLVFQAALGPAGQAQATIEQIQDLTVKAVGAAKVLGGKAAFPNMEIAARDVRQLLSGAASAADTPMFQLLYNHINMTTEAFNALPAPERFAVFAKALDKALTPAALKKHKEGWEGMSEAIDEYRQRAEKAFNEQMFKRSKKALGTLVSSLGTSQAEIETNARRLGTGMADGIGAGLEAINKAFGWVQEKVTPVIDFFTEKYNEVKSLLGQSDTLENAGEGWRVIGDAILFVGGGLLQLVGAAAGFIGLGAGAVFVGIGAAAKQLGDNIAYINTEWQKLGGGFEGVVRLLENSWEGFLALRGELEQGSRAEHDKRVAQHQLQNQNQVRAWLGQPPLTPMPNTPVPPQTIKLEKLGTPTKPVPPQTIKLEKLGTPTKPVPPIKLPIPTPRNIPDVSTFGNTKSQTRPVRIQPIVNQTIQQNITAPTPDKAAAMVNQGITRATKSAFPDVLGLPITVVPR
jgi:hypothetical protein